MSTSEAPSRHTPERSDSRPGPTAVQAEAEAAAAPRQAEQGPVPVSAPVVPVPVPGQGRRSRRRQRAVGSVDSVDSVDAGRFVAVRRVRRVVRHVDLWSVCRLSAMLYLSLMVVFAVAGVGLWLVASATGARQGFERLVASTLLLKNFRFDSVRILLASLAIGAVFVAVATLLTVVFAAFFNLICDVVGGLELTVIEEEPAQAVVYRDGPPRGL